MIRGTNVTGCDPVECRFNQGWKCNQPEIGIVPLNAILVCSCANGVGTFANESLNCAPFPCPFPDRCLGNGTTCIDGATGPSCSLCSKRWYRWRDDCRPCPEGIPPGLVLISIFAGVFVLWLGPKISKLTTPQAQAILKNMVSTFQYLSLSLTLRLRWPPELLRFFAFVRTLTNAVDLAAPECLATNWSYYVYVQSMLIGLAAVFGLTFLYIAVLYARQAAVRPATGEARLVAKSWTARIRMAMLPAALSTNSMRLEDPDRSMRHRVRKLFGRRNGLYNFVAFAVSVAFIYVVNVLCDAFDCFSATEGMKLRADPKILCDTDVHKRFLRLATGCIVGIGVGVPMLVTATLVRARRSALKNNVASNGEPLLTRPLWLGLGDPSTRAGLGPLYEPYRFLAMPVSGWRQLRGVLLRTVAPSFEALLLTQKLAVVLVTNLVADNGAARPGAQIGVHAVWALLVAWLRPYQRLDVRVPVLVWLPALPPSWRPQLSEAARGRFEATLRDDKPLAQAEAAASAGTEDFRTHECHIFGMRCGWAYVTHVFVGDALNHSAISTSLVQVVNLSTALIAGGGGERALGAALIGINALSILLGLAAWLTSVINWRVNTEVLLEAMKRQEATKKNDELNPLRLPSMNVAADADLSKDETSKWRRAQAYFLASISDARDTAEYLEYDETMQIVHFAGERLRDLEARGKANDAEALKRTVGVLVAQELARLQQFLIVYRCDEVAQERLLRTEGQITALELSFFKHGLELDSSFAGGDEKQKADAAADSGGELGESSAFSKPKKSIPSASSSDVSLVSLLSTCAAALLIVSLGLLEPTVAPYVAPPPAPYLFPTPPTPPAPPSPPPFAPPTPPPPPPPPPPPSPPKKPPPPSPPPPSPPPPYAPTCFPDAATCAPFCAGPASVCAFDPVGPACGGSDWVPGYSWACIAANAGATGVAVTKSLSGWGLGNDCITTASRAGGNAQCFGCGGGGACALSPGGPGGNGTFGGGGGGAATADALTGVLGGHGGQGAAIIGIVTAQSVNNQPTSYLFLSNITLNNFTVPAGAVSLTIWAVGAGGGGDGVASTGGLSNAPFSAGGGGAGGISRVTLPSVTPGEVVQVLIPAGGIGGDGNNAGGSGGNTTVTYRGNVVTYAYGGSGGGVTFNSAGGVGGGYFYGDAGAQGGTGGYGAGNILSSQPYGGGGGGSIGSQDGVTGAQYASLGEGGSGAAAADGGITLFAALGALGLVPPDPAAAGTCYNATGCGGACALAGRTCHSYPASTTCPYRCDAACFSESTCGARCPPGSACSYDMYSTCSSTYGSSNSWFTCSTSFYYKMSSRQLGVKCFNDANCGSECSRGNICQQDVGGTICSSPGYYACAPGPPPTPLPGTPACFPDQTCGGFCSADETCALNGTSACVATSNFTFACAPKSTAVAVVRGDLCFAVSDCDGTCEAYGATCGVSYPAHCTSGMTFSCKQDCTSATTRWNQTCGGGFCSLLGNSSSCVASTRTCSAAGSYDCIGPDTVYASDSTCGGNCDTDEFCTSLSTWSPTYTCTKYTGCFSNSCYSNVCPSGTRCMQLQAGEGVCAAASYGGYTCAALDTSSCMADNNCYGACPLGTRCTAVTPSLAGSWGVCDSVAVAYSSTSGMYYNGTGSSVFAMGFTCRACTAGDTCFSSTGCFDSALCSSCPRGTMCANVGVSAPCSSATTQAGRSYTCLNVTLAPGCYSSSSSNYWSCDSSCGGGTQCLHSTQRDCVRFPTRTGPTASDVALYSSSFYKCTSPTECYASSVCNNNCMQVPGTVCSWAGAAGPCSAAAPGYTCLAPGPSKPTAGCLSNATCGGGCPAGSLCTADSYTMTCSATVYAPSPPPPTPPAPPALVPASTLYQGWTYTGYQDYNHYCNTSSYDSTAATASGGVYPYNFGDTIDCKTWKLAATICTTQPAQQPGSMSNYFCPSSGGFTDPTFGTYCATSQQYVCNSCTAAMPGSPCYLLCSYNSAPTRTSITMVGCASREVFSDGSAPSVYQPPPPAQLSNYRCMSSSPSACFVNSSCLGVCPTGSYCSYTQRCSTNFMEGQYSCFRFNSTGGDCSMSYQDCAASCPIGSGCNYDQTCLSGTGTSPSGQPYRCRVGAPSNGNPYGNPGYNPGGVSCTTQASCAATCQAPATCIRDTNAPICSQGHYVCVAPDSCLPVSDCYGQCSSNQTCSYIDTTAPCSAGSGPGFACRDLVQATCFNEPYCAYRCPAGTSCAYDFARRACGVGSTASNSSFYMPMGMNYGQGDVRGAYACLSASSCFAPSDAVACEAACDGTPCLPVASLKEACGASSAAVPPPGSHDGFALVCPVERLPPRRGSTGPYIVPLVTSLPLAAAMIVTIIAKVLTAEQRARLTRVLPRWSMSANAKQVYDAADAAPAQQPETVPEIEPAAAT